ncbi:MAG: hypothetical protein DGJ47_000616 [Rickettsiaceae bacterium]
MGTPEFAVPTLRKLIESKTHNVKAVFTREPKPKGRGMVLQPSPIAELADKHGVEVHTPKTLRKEENQQLVHQIKADIIVVVAYGFIIPQVILDSKKYGCLNIHPSKLPKYRGAAPLQRTIINNEKDTDICVMQMDAGIDTGDVLMRQNLSIPDDMTLMELHDQCASIGGELLIKTLDNIDNITPEKQLSEGATYADKLTKEEGEIFWDKDHIDTIYGKVKGMNPWPGAYFKMHGKTIKILEAKIVNTMMHDSSFGAILNKDFEVACLGGVLKIIKLKPEGKSAMLATDFLKGHSITDLHSK